MSRIKRQDGGGPEVPEVWGSEGSGVRHCDSKRAQKRRARGVVQVGRGGAGPMGAEPGYTGQE